MKAIQFYRSLPRYALLKLLRSRARHWAPALAPVRLAELPEPKLPSPRWARVRPVLAGICGSDTATIAAKGSPYLAPVTSMPFVLGHEVVGVVEDVGAEVTRVRPGDRVVLHPALGCRVREIDPPCDACGGGADALCRNVTRGIIAPGIQTGYCRDTGGAWSEALVAHDTQLYAVPPDLPDTAAVLIEPFACALHAVLRAADALGVAPGRPTTSGWHGPAQRARGTGRTTVLVIGCGTIGLLTLAALRAAGCQARVVAVARHAHQREHARTLGADGFIDDRGPVSERYAAWAAALHAEVLPPELGKPMVIGGADVTFDCVASSTSIDDALRFTRAGGTLVLVGMPGVPRGVDFTPLWYKELTLHAAYAHGPERTAEGVVDTFDLAIEMVARMRAPLAALVGRPYALTEYRDALRAALNVGAGRTVKTVFAIGGP